MRLCMLLQLDAVWRLSFVVCGCLLVFGCVCGRAAFLISEDLKVVWCAFRFAEMLERAEARLVEPGAANFGVHAVGLAFT